MEICVCLCVCRNGFLRLGRFPYPGNAIYQYTVSINGFTPILRA